MGTKSNCCARCGLKFDAPGKGRKMGVALDTADGKVHFPQCAHRSEIAAIATKLDAVKVSR